MQGNYEKQDHYKKLKAKLSKALKNEFWFEACMIEYAIIEDRTSSILFHANVCENAYASSKKLSNKLNSIEYQIGKEHAIIGKKVNRATIEQIRLWKENRNDLVHRACILFSEDDAKAIAIEGYELVKAISNDSSKVTRYANQLAEVKKNVTV